MKRLVLLFLVVLMIPVGALGGSMYGLKDIKSYSEVSFDWNEVSPDVKAKGKFHDLTHVGLRIWVPNDWVVHEESWDDRVFYNITQGNSIMLSIECDVDNRPFEYIAWYYGSQLNDVYSFKINGIKAACVQMAPMVYYTYIDSAAGRCTAAFVVSEDAGQQAANNLDAVASSFQLIDSPLAGFRTKLGLQEADISQFAIVSSSAQVYGSPEPDASPLYSVYPNNLLYIVEEPKLEIPGWCKVQGGATDGYVRCRDLYRLAQDELVGEVVEMLQCGGDPYSALEAAGMTFKDLGLE